MSDPSRQAADEGFHEIQLSGKQIVFLFMATTVVSIVIFLCGVLVGRGIQAQRAAQTETLATEPGRTEAVSGAGPTAPAPEVEELTYPERLGGAQPPKEDIKPPTVASPPPPEAAPPPPASAGEWIVQIAALRDRTAAQAIVKRLADKDYPAFVVDPVPGDPVPVHRVRIGPYRDRAEAERVSRRLEREEQFKPLIIR